MRLTYCTFVLMLLFSLSAFAQERNQAVEFKEASTFYKRVYDKAYRYADTLSALESKGTLIFHFSLDSNDRATKLKAFDETNCYRLALDSNNRIADLEVHNEKLPILVEMIAAILLGEKFSTVDSFPIGTRFVLPVYYDYQRRKTEKIGHILERMPKLDLDKWQPKQRRDDFKAFFDLPDDDRGLFGIRCIFMPWVTLRGKIE